MTRMPLEIASDILLRCLPSEPSSQPSDVPQSFSSSRALGRILPVPHPRHHGRSGFSVISHAAIRLPEVIIYRGYSNMMQPPPRTEQHRKYLHALNTRLVERPALIMAPPSAATRIKPPPLKVVLQERWNQEITALFEGLTD
ncbi:hypothetical protein FB45DRAFT_801323 [Roridomyces roridus]|uniref:Uncharacterized protein n=1 Tax=Roridomyces roridus TaxID=1738132 RepID=A0AAD7BCB0_9AGAR|nr:hypothetical protein FB45DRAFT_801323 [Roridomyces roridus]